METESAVPHAKKRRRDAPEEQEPEEIVSLSPHELHPPEAQAPPALAPDLPHPKPTCESEESHGQEPPGGAGGGEEGDGVDRISSLPDAVLGEIISLLPTKDAASSQVLASRWRYLWLSAPLNLDHSGLPADEEAQLGIISQILAVHPGPARRLSVPELHLQHRHPMVDSWLLSPALDNLEELEFDNGDLHYSCRRPRLLSLPASALRFSATLRVATISQCDLLDEAVETLLFPRLRQLALDCVRISEGSLQSLIAGCPVLECLLLEGSYGFRCLRIGSPSLRSIGVSSGELIIEDAPSLEKVLQLEPRIGLHLTVISAPKLETLGCLSDRDYNSKLVFGTTVIQSCVSGNTNLWRRRHRTLIRCLEIRLKAVVLKNYRGIKSQVNFATFFVLNAKMLELMRFEGGEYNNNKMFIAEQRRSLQLEKRASRGARFYFTTGRRCHHRYYLTHIKHVRDLSITDPFECTC